LIELRAGDEGDARVLLLGGAPLGEQIVMWWNFIGRSHEEIVAFRANWQARIGAAPARTGGPAGAGTTDGPEQFGLPVGDTLPPIPAPPLPNVTLRPRR
jgi:hypothetical protein